MVKTKAKTKTKSIKKSIKKPVKKSATKTVKPIKKNNSNQNSFNFIIITSFLAIIALATIGFVKTSYEASALTGLASYSEETFKIYECTPGHSCGEPIQTYKTACVGKDVYYLNIQNYCDKEGYCTIEKEFLDVTRFIGTCPSNCVDGFCI
jgi:hypothetical protein